MRYLVTGITGFCAPHLANIIIDEGNEIYGLIRHSNGRETDILDIVPPEKFSKIKFLYGDLTNLYSISKIFKQHQFDGVFHLAAQSHPPTSFTDPIGTFENNIMGSANLIESIMQFQPKCKLLFCSTSEVYGNVGQDGRRIEITDTIMPANPYGVSKAAIDLYMQERMINGKLKGVITRAFSHTGPRRGKNFSISSDAYQIARMMKGLQEHILKVGNLETVRVVLDVRDVAWAYYLLMNSEEATGKIFNVCGDVPHKMQYYTDLLISFSNLTDVKQQIEPKFYRPIDIHYQHGNCDELKSLTGWSPTYNINTTIYDLLHYWLRKME
jgi:GDP-4-dehydro-6-deoxy-D-mannose reductase